MSVRKGPPRSADLSGLKRCECLLRCEAEFEVRGGGSSSEEADAEAEAKLRSRVERSTSGRR